MSERASISLATVLAALIVAGAICWTAPRKEEISFLRVEIVKLEALLDSAMMTLHHERLHHFREIVSEDVAG